MEPWAMQTRVNAPQSKSIRSLEYLLHIQHVLLDLCCGAEQPRTLLHGTNAIYTARHSQYILILCWRVLSTDIRKNVNRIVKFYVEKDDRESGFGICNLNLGRILQTSDNFRDYSSYLFRGLDVGEKDKWNKKQYQEIYLSQYLEFHRNSNEYAEELCNTKAKLEAMCLIAKLVKDNKKIKDLEIQLSAELRSTTLLLARFLEFPLKLMDLTDPEDAARSAIQNKNGGLTGEADGSLQAGTIISRRRKLLVLLLMNLPWLPL